MAVEIDGKLGLRCQNQPTQNVNGHSIPLPTGRMFSGESSIREPLCPTKRFGEFGGGD